MLAAWPVSSHYLLPLPRTFLCISEQGLQCQHWPLAPRRSPERSTLGVQPFLLGQPLPLVPVPSTHPDLEHCKLFPSVRILHKLVLAEGRANSRRNEGGS